MSRKMIEFADRHCEAAMGVILAFAIGLFVAGIIGILSGCSSIPASPNGVITDNGNTEIYVGPSGSAWGAYVDYVVEGNQPETCTSETAPLARIRVISKKAE